MRLTKEGIKRLDCMGGGARAVRIVSAVLCLTVFAGVLAGVSGYGRAAATESDVAEVTYFIRKKRKTRLPICSGKPSAEIWAKARMKINKR